MQEESSIVFGNQEVPKLCFCNHKTTHTLEESDPIRLHPEEVNKFKIVMYRFVRAQFCGSILSKAFDKATNNN